MQDQADELRQLIRRGGHAVASAVRPRLVAVCGSRPSAGTSTVAIHAAMALARSARRTIYVDAGQRSALASDRSASRPLAEMLAGRRRFFDVLAPGPGGICVVPNVWSAIGHADNPCTGQQRLISEFKELRGLADLVLLDAGSGSSLAVRRFCQSADFVLLVVPADSNSLAEACAVLKVIAGCGPPHRLSIAVNGVGDLAEAESWRQRLACVGRECLGWAPALAGCVAHDRLVGAVGGARVLPAHAPAAQGIHDIADAILSALANRAAPLPAAFCGAAAE